MLNDCKPEDIIDDKDSTTPPFTREGLIQIINEVFERNIGHTTYDVEKSESWNTKCVEEITYRLVKHQGPYKYIVASALLQTGNGSGLNVSTVSFWNKKTDSPIKVFISSRRIVPMGQLLQFITTTRCI
ncbi:unnamed protein product, partial [Mesorhabditis belari]|uniref:Uncharacterized protein n=1 Tax=Mesorhabditis belari TaxID=2138241 RepID=A0AAF3FR69_9BILA